MKFKIAVQINETLQFRVSERIHIDIYAFIIAYIE